MMISPKLYIEEFKDSPVEELIKERKKILMKLNKLENELLKIDEDRYPLSIYMDPNPEVIYKITSDYLIEIILLLKEKCVLK